MKKENNLYDISADLAQMFGEPDSEQRAQAIEQAWAEYNAQVLYDTRKRMKMTQSVLAQKIGANKGYISRVERGLTIPSVGTFYRMIAAMGCRVEILYPDGTGSAVAARNII